MRWKVMAITNAGVYFAGPDSLVEEPERARWFEDYDQAAARARDIVAFNLAGVTQIRLISEAFAGAK